MVETVKKPGSIGDLKEGDHHIQEFPGTEYPYCPSECKRGVIDKAQEQDTIRQNQDLGSDNQVTEIKRKLIL